MSMAKTCAPGTTRAVEDKTSVRRVRDMAPTMAINNKTEVISNGSRYFVNSPSPIECVSPTFETPTGRLLSEVCTEYKMNAV